MVANKTRFFCGMLNTMTSSFVLAVQDQKINKSAFRVSMTMTQSNGGLHPRKKDIL